MSPDLSNMEMAMSRCTRTNNLEVHHKRRDGGNGLDNAEVLCEKCHQATASYGTPGESPPPFDFIVKMLAKLRAGSQCECTRTSGCH